LFAHCLKLLTDKPLAMRMGQRGSILVREGYSKETMADRFVALVNHHAEDRSNRRDAATQSV
jgi:hypothetical protein